MRASRLRGQVFAICFGDHDFVILFKVIVEVSGAHVGLGPDDTPKLCRCIQSTLVTPVKANRVLAESPL